MSEKVSTGSGLYEAIKLATWAHAGQIDRDGKLHIEHALRVLGRLAAAGFPEEILMAGVLHDVVEDTVVTAGALESKFGLVVASIVEAVTIRPNEVYVDFVKRSTLKASSRAVKRADVADNLARSAGIPKLASLEKRYLKAAKILGGLELLPPEEEV